MGKLSTLRSARNTRYETRCTSAWQPRLLGCAIGALLSLGAGAASATSPLEVPDNGAQQMARGGAWVARASNSLAAYYNPAALSGIESGFVLGTNIVFNKVCFERLGTDGQPATTTVGVTYREICNDNAGDPNPIPHLAGNLRLTEELGIGLAFVPPAALGKLEFPDTSPASLGSNEATFASPQRYLLLKADGVLLNPVLSAGYAITDQLRIGAGFIFGFGNLQLSNAAMAQPGANDTEDNVAGDVRADVDVADAFIPGGVFGVLFSPTEQLDFGLSVHVQDAFRGKGDLVATSGYWGPNGRVAPDGGTKSSSADTGADLVEVSIPNPLQVRLGVAFRQPRDGAPGYLSADARRDPLSEDVFDVELDLEYTQNSSFDAIQVRVPKDTVYILSRATDGTVTQVGPVPENSDVELKLKDTFGVRVGGDYVVMPDFLAVRAGMWFQTAAADKQHLHVQPLAGARFGVSGGAQVRVPLVDIEVGYMLVSQQEVDNAGDGAIKTISGTGSLGNRSPYAINGGRASATAHIFSAGISSHF